MKVILFFALAISFGVVIVPSVENTREVLRGGGHRNMDSVDTLYTSSSMTSSLLSHPDCQAKVNRLEKVWNERRQVRTDILEEAKEANKNIYDYLWRRTLPDKSNPMYEKQKEADAIRQEKYIFDLFEPEAVCLTEERFGGSSSKRYKAFGDGPKFACGVDYVHELYKGKEGTDGNCLVYSIGSNNQIDFEVAVKEQIGCEIHTFDPTLKAPFVGDRYAEFHPWGLGKDGEVVKFKTKFTTKSLESIMKELNHINRKIDIFKIDCEGCEYDVMPPVFDAIAQGQLQIDQILIEMHRTPNSYEVLAHFFEAADKAGYRITHKERNHWGCNGYGCVEYVFVSEDFLRKATAAAIC